MRMSAGKELTATNISTIYKQISNSNKLVPFNRMARLNSSVHELLVEVVLKSLFASKIYTIVDFLNSDIKMLTRITNLTYKEVLDIRKHILNTSSAKIHNGLNYYNHLLQTTSLTSTNIKNLDNLLGGGLLSGNIYEFCGFSSSGKSQMCLTIALNISHYFEKYIYYIDTKHDFSARRLQDILEERNVSEEISGHILNRIKVKQISDQFELVSSLYDIKTELSEGLNCPLIIIDSLPAIFYHTGNYSNTKTVMNHFVSIARYISTELNMVIIVTNLMVQDDQNALGRVSYKPGLGTYWLTVPNTRILLNKLDEGTCSLKVIKSTTTGIDKQCSVSITQCGVE